MPNSRLESTPELRPIAKKIRRLSQAKQRAFAIAVCARGFAETGLGDASALAVIAKLKGGEPVTQPELDALKMAAEDADMVYLRLLNEDDAKLADIKPLFQRARLLAGLVMVFDENPVSAALECAYEVAISSSLGRPLLERALGELHAVSD